MKNIFVGGALLLAALIGGNTAMAQNQNCGNCPNGKDNTTYCKMPANKPCNQPCDSVCKPCGPGRACSVFDGLNLSDKQKEQIETLRKESPRAMNRKDRLAKIKTILTPEQYQQFLENAFVNGGNDNRGPRKFDQTRNRKIEKARRIEKTDKK